LESTIDVHTIVTVPLLWHFHSQTVKKSKTSPCRARRRTVISQLLKIAGKENTWDIFASSKSPHICFAPCCLVTSLTISDDGLRFVHDVLVTISTIGSTQAAPLMYSSIGTISCEKLI
jgi:hypothetical protein